MTPQSVRTSGDALIIDGPLGPVLIRQRSDGLIANYSGNQLVNGTALAYSEKLLEEVIEYTSKYPLPWRIDADGTHHITDHKKFYEQTFNPELAGIETLKRWLS
jgi:hypothetical protein